MRLDPSCWTPETWCMISAACFFYLTGWIKSAPTYSYPRWIVVALIFIFAEMFNLHYSDRLQEFVFYPEICRTTLEAKYDTECC